MDKEEVNLLKEFTLSDQLRKIIILVHQISRQELNNNKIKIEPNQLPILMLPHLYPGITQQEIAQKTSRVKASVNRTIKILEGLEYLTVTENPNDKRQKNIRTTSYGNVEAKKILKIRKLMEAKLKVVYGEQEYHCLNTSLTLLLEKLTGFLDTNTEPKK